MSLCDTCAPVVELSDLLVGTWRVDGPDISGHAEYASHGGGRLLVAFVDFEVGGSPMRVIQHIAHDEDSDTLNADNSQYSEPGTIPTVRQQTRPSSTRGWVATADGTRSTRVVCG